MGVYLQRAAWRGQKNNSKDRGIGFFFTYEEWCQWWEDELGPDWMSLRGCKAGQFVMARHLDKGDYRVGNVKCVLQSSNHAEANYRRMSPRAKDWNRREEYIRRLELWDAAMSIVDEPRR